MLNHQISASHSHTKPERSAPAVVRSSVTLELQICVLRDTCAVEERTGWAPYGAGGVWPRRQIDEILRRHGMEAIDMQPLVKMSIPRKLQMAASVMLRFGRSISWSRMSVASAVYSYEFYQQNL